MEINWCTSIFDKKTDKKIESFYGNKSRKKADEYIKINNIDRNTIFIITEDRSEE